MQRRKHLSVSALCFCGAGHVWKSGLIRAESKSPHVTLMYIYVFRLFLYLGCWQNFGDWEDGGPIGVRLGSPRGAVIGLRGGGGAGLWDYSSISLPPQIHQTSGAALPGNQTPEHRTLTPSTYSPRCSQSVSRHVPALRCCCGGSVGCISGGRLLRSGETDGPFLPVKTRRY